MAPGVDEQKLIAVGEGLCRAQPAQTAVPQPVEQHHGLLPVTQAVVGQVSMAQAHFAGRGLHPLSLGSRRARFAPKGRNRAPVSKRVPESATQNLAIS